MNKLEERFQEVIGESDLHLPPWISENPSVDYPIEEAEVVSRCATITKEIAIGFLDWVKGNYEPAITGWWSLNDKMIYKSEQLFEMYLETLK